MNFANIQKKSFTLVELLVVIAILAILASILIPSLNKARYKAKNAVCVSQIKQIHTALMLYGVNNSYYYPAGDITRGSAASIKDSNSSGSYDLRPHFRNYLGELNVIMKCPLANKWWWEDTNQGGTRDFDNSNDRRIRTPYAFYFNPTAVMPNTRHWKNRAAVRRIGDTLQPTASMADNGEYNVIMSDATFNVSWGGSFGVMMTQESFSGGESVSGNYTNYGKGNLVLRGMFSTSNFCRDDGSVKMYNKVGFTSIGESFINMNSHNGGQGWMIPLDMRVD